MLPPLPNGCDVRGFDPNAGKLAWLVDAYYQKAKAYDAPALVRDGILGGWQKTSEGGPYDKAWSIARDKELAEKMLEGALDIATKHLENGMAIGDGYHWPTIWRDRKRFYHDAEDEVGHALRQREKLLTELHRRGFDTEHRKRLRFILDAEDKGAEIPGSQRLEYLLYMLSRLESELGYPPILYVSERWMRKNIIDVKGEHGPTLLPRALKVLSRFPLMTPDYDENKTSTLEERLSGGPDDMPASHSTCAVWQCLSKYRGPDGKGPTLDLSLADTRRIWT